MPHENRPLIREDWLSREDITILKLRQLYESYGYIKYKMRAFEDYELYLDNKSFLNDQNIITFNDVNGRVLALRPDVTLSIAKNSRADIASMEKLYYLENTYRLDVKNQTYREISQLGLECFGKLDEYHNCEALNLAALTLSEIGEEWALVISHTGFAQKYIEGLHLPPDQCAALTDSIRQKNPAQIKHMADSWNIQQEAADLLVAVTHLSGPFSDTIIKARGLGITRDMSGALDQLESAYKFLTAAGPGNRFRLDFSIVNDINYYSGVIFQGFIEHVPRPVLSGGNYSGLMQKFGRDIDAIGFAVYLNELSRLYPAAYRGVKAHVLYDENADICKLSRAIDALRREGFVVCAESAFTGSIGCCFLYRFNDGELTEVV
jgi:ATP phosphoribosyltransferase regulatory subunit